MQQVNGMGYYVLPAIALWGTERLLRLARIAALNFPPLHCTSINEDTLELLSSDAVRLTVRRRARFGLATWRPAQTMFVTIPEISRLPFESHPFTISSVADPKNDEREIVFIIRARDGFTGRLRDAARDAGADRATEGVGRKVNVILNGPYGTPPNLSGYETVIFFAGKWSW
jgi:ferric-chelate reductase